MKQNKNHSSFLRDILPEFAAELETLLRERDHKELAEQVKSLRVVDRCRCKDDFCGMFYVQPFPYSKVKGKFSCFNLKPVRGMIILEIVDRTIVAVEVLFRSDVRDALLKALP